MPDITGAQVVQEWEIPPTFHEHLQLPKTTEVCTLQNEDLF